MFWGELGGDLRTREFNIFNISAEKCDFQKKLILSGEMLNMLNSGGPVESKCASFRGNVEYVNMLIMLNVLGKAWGPPPIF